MISLTVIATVFHEIAAITWLQFDVINFCDAARSTAANNRVVAHVFHKEVVVVCSLQLHNNHGDRQRRVQIQTNYCTLKEMITAVKQYSGSTYIARWCDIPRGRALLMDGQYPDTALLSNKPDLCPEFQAGNTRGWAIPRAGNTGGPTVTRRNT